MKLPYSYILCSTSVSTLVISSAQGCLSSSTQIMEFLECFRNMDEGRPSVFFIDICFYITHLLLGFVGAISSSTKKPLC